MERSHVRWNVLRQVGFSPLSGVEILRNRRGVTLVDACGRVHQHRHYPDGPVPMSDIARALPWFQRRQPADTMLIRGFSVTYLGPAGDNDHQYPSLWYDRLEVGSLTSTLSRRADHVRCTPVVARHRPKGSMPRLAVWGDTRGKPGRRKRLASARRLSTRRQSDLPATAAKAGVNPGCDYVFCTHMHGDGRRTRVRRATRAVG